MAADSRISALDQDQVPVAPDAGFDEGPGADPLLRRSA